MQLHLRRHSLIYFQQEALAGGSKPTSYTTFMDGNLMTEIHVRIIDSIQWSTGFCYMMFRQICPKERIFSHSEEKYIATACHCREQLDMDIDTWRSVVIYPTYKRDACTAGVELEWTKGSLHTQRYIATVLGHTITASTILPLVSYFSIYIQLWFNLCLARLLQRGKLEPYHPDSIWTALQYYR